MWYRKWGKRILVCSLLLVLSAGILSLDVWASAVEEVHTEDQQEEDPGGEQMLPGIYTKEENSRLRSAVTSVIAS